MCGVSKVRIGCVEWAKCISDRQDKQDAYQMCEISGLTYQMTEEIKNRMIYMYKKIGEKGK